MFKTLKNNKKLFIIALPIALQNLISVGVSMLDILMVGRISESQLAGIGQANQVYFILTLIIFGISSGAGVLTSQYYGKKDVKPIKAIVIFCLKISTFLGLLLSLIVIIFPRNVMMIFTNDESTITNGIRYLRFIAFSYPFSSFVGVYLISLRSLNEVKISFIIYFISFVLNLILNALLIYGVWFFPRMEIEGAALATLICRICEFIMVIIYARFFEKKLMLKSRDLSLSIRPYFKSLVMIGIGALISEALWGIGISIQSALIGRYDQEIIYAYNCVKVVQDLISVFIVGICSASGVIIGQLIGKNKRQEAVLLARELLILCVFCGMFFSGIMIIITPLIPAILSSTPESSAYISRFMRVATLSVFIQSLTFTTMSGILRAGGNTTFCAVLDVFGVVVIKLILGSLLLFLGIKPELLLLCFCLDEGIKYVITTPIVIKGKWIRKMSLVIE